MSKFKIGDVVTLKSGGPKMTINNIDTNICCTWFNQITNSNYEGPLEADFKEDQLLLSDVKSKIISFNNED